MITPLCEPILGETEKKWLSKCIDSGFVSSIGPLVDEFEHAFAERAGSQYAIATITGTAALHAAMLACGIGPGDSVIIPDLTFVASMNPAMYCGATPVLADVDQTSWCLDPSVVAGICRNMAEAGKLPAAIVPVHLYGCACDMSAIMEIARQYGLHVIEDATEALGTLIDGRQVGSFGDIGCFSFNGNKMITTGCGGMVTTDSEELARHVRYLVSQARDEGPRYIHGEVGFNYRMSSLSAALGLAQLERLDAILERKREIAAAYAKAFQPIEWITCHPDQRGINGSFWLYSVTLDSQERRELLIERLNADGIQTRRFFTPLHSQPYCQGDMQVMNCSGVVTAEHGKSDILAETGLNLPSSPAMTDTQQQTVIDAILKT